MEGGGGGALPERDGGGACGGGSCAHEDDCAGGGGARKDGGLLTEPNTRTHLLVSAWLCIQCLSYVAMLCLHGSRCFSLPQARLRAKLHKEEKKTNALKNDGDVQGVELELGQDATPKPSSGCCSML